MLGGILHERAPNRISIRGESQLHRTNKSLARSFSSCIGNTRKGASRGFLLFLTILIEILNSRPYHFLCFGLVALGGSPSVASAGSLDCVAWELAHSRT